MKTLDGSYRARLGVLSLVGRLLRVRFHACTLPYEEEAHGCPPPSVDGHMLTEGFKAFVDHAGADLAEERDDTRVQRALAIAYGEMARAALTTGDHAPPRVPARMRSYDARNPDGPTCRGEDWNRPGQWPARRFPR